MRIRHPLDVVSTIIIAWVFAYVAVNLLVPDRWVLDYQVFYAEDICRDHVQTIYGKRYAPLSLDSFGVDKLFTEDGRPVDRLEYQGQYQRGISEGTWKFRITEPEGQYYWESTTLKVRLPFFIDKYISGVKSNTFHVYECSE